MFILFRKVVIGLIFAAVFFSAQAGEVAIVKDSKSRWQIVSPSNKTAGVSFATSELQKYVSEISGCRLPVEQKEKWFKPAIIVGLREELSEKDKALLPPRKEGFDGYAMAISEKALRVVIAGDNSQGVIYGVYDFLERLGCRWFYPTEDSKDPEVVPKNRTISLAGKSWAMASPIQFRICNGSAWYFKMDHAAAKRQIDWAMKARYNMMGWQSENIVPLFPQYARFAESGVLTELEKRGMAIHGPAHSFDQFLPDEEYFAEHSEWFGMRDGKRVRQNFAGAQFCWSNVEARKKFAENVATFANKTPLIKILCIVPFDGGKACECSECAKVGASSVLMILMSEVIERIHQSRPDLLVETVGGYGPVMTPPKDVAIHPQQRIAWAHWGRHHASGYDDPAYDKKENLELWRKASPGGITLVQYYTDNFAEPWVMGTFANTMQSDRKYFLRNQIDSIYMLMYSFGYWWNHGLNGYVAGRCFYDVSLDPFDEIKDYALNYFGKDAGSLLSNYCTEWARDIELSYRVRGDSRKEDRARLREQRVKWIQPAVEAAKNNSIFAYRVGKIERLHAVAERLTEVHRQRDSIRWLRRAGKFDEAARQLEKSKIYTDEVMDFLFATADLNQGLMERKEIPSFIRAGVKDWIAEESKAIAAKDTIVKEDFWYHLNEVETLPAEVAR